MNEIEKRSLENSEVISSEVKEDKLIFSGYVAKFDEKSEFMGFYETIDKRAFDETLKENKNIFALFNHDWNMPLGSTRNKTLSLSVDDVGLRFDLEAKAQTSYMKDVNALVEAEELRGMSFGFNVKEGGDKWEKSDGKYYRTLTNIDLSEITLTHIPAYPTSEVTKRNYDAFKKELTEQMEKEKSEKQILKKILSDY